jgi:hypothetical protein
VTGCVSMVATERWKYWKRPHRYSSSSSLSWGEALGNKQNLTERFVPRGEVSPLIRKIIPPMRKKQQS